MPKIRRQIVNPYIRFGRKAQGPYAQNLGGGTHARAITKGVEGPCFTVVASIGDVYFTTGGGSGQADILTLQFSANADASCGVDGDWAFYVNGAPAFNETLLQLSGSQAFWQIRKDEGQGPGPEDELTFDYTPGACRKAGEDPGDCDLPQYVAEPVTNSIYGPITARVGDIDDRTVVVVFPVTPAVAGTTWTLRINDNPVGLEQPAYIVGDSVRLESSAPIDSSDVVTVDHNVGAGTECTAVDGRECWDFADFPVENVLGANFWMREDGGQWRVEDTGRWQLET